MRIRLGKIGVKKSYKKVPQKKRIFSESKMKIMKIKKYIF
jgi:hypothetical protein